jgi:glycosyltransferase involved in cell wall biosynthesis
MILFGALAGAKQILMGDCRQTIARSRAAALLIETPLLALELAFGYALLVPLSWALTALVGAALSLRDLALKMRRQGGGKWERESMSALYVRANPATSATGGQASHIAGFQSGAVACGHELEFIASSVAGIDCSRSQTTVIPPSSAVSATRALFELWNNLLFTASAVGQMRSRADEFDFIYQRYSRFNWTGAALSVATTLPLALEYNGSEVWLSRNWDPVGLVRLLERFERLNLKAADLIFVVSEVERDNLIRAGIDAGKIIVNPNGVDTEKFRPGCGGAAIRSALGFEDKSVVGFVSTFGPWHGAPVLAEAATIVGGSRCHFLFIGDGDERPRCEAIIREAGRARLATFTGRLDHERIPAYLDACDILASPHVASKDGSEFFGSPTKLFEYLAMQRAVVASRLGQIADVITDEENGLLVEPGSPDDLARAIERLAADEQLRAKLGASARRRAEEHYTWARNAARVFDAMGKKL